MTARAYLPLMAIMTLMLVACSSAKPPAHAAILPKQMEPPPAANPTPPAVAPSPPPALAAAPPDQTPLPPAIDAPADSCGASELAGLVGKPKTDIPVPVDPSRRRVICTTCPAGAVHDPKRLTILFDRATGIVQSVGCG
jgi:hypothetical protein